MNVLARVLQDVRSDLLDLGIRAALIGGIAVSARAEPRFTRDVDLAVAVAGDAEAERLLFLLRGRGYTPIASFENLAVDRLSTVRLVPRRGSEKEVLVDLLLASSGIEAEIVAGSTVIDVFSGVPFPVARVGHLLALKVLSYDAVRRVKDAVDIQALLVEADPAELGVCEEALDLITARGYNRDRDLHAIFRSFR